MMTQPLFSKLKNPANVIELDLNQPAEAIFASLREHLLNGRGVYFPGIGILSVEGRGVRGNKESSDRFRPVIISNFDPKFLLDAADRIAAGLLSTNRQP